MQSVDQMITRHLRVIEADLSALGKLPWKTGRDAKKDAPEPRAKNSNGTDHAA